MKIFELYDNIVKERVSLHKTLRGALNAMAGNIQKITPALCSDYEEGAGLPSMKLSLQYEIFAREVKE